MSIADAFAPAEARYRDQVVAETFGHLAPRPRQVYSGEVLFARGEYHDMCVIKSTIDVDDSPGFEDLHSHFWKDRIGGKEIKVGSVYRWAGTYRKFKNGKHRFSGRVRKVA